MKKDKGVPQKSRRNAINIDKKRKIKSEKSKQIDEKKYYYLKKEIKEKEGM